MIYEKNTPTYHQVLVAEELVDFLNHYIQHTDRKLKIITINGQKYLYPLKCSNKPKI